MPSFIGKKLGMTSLFDANQRYVACTLIEVVPNVVTQVKTVEKDGYNAVQLAAIDKKAKHTSKPMQGHFRKASTTPKRVLHETESPVAEVELGQTIAVNEVFEEGEFVDVFGQSKGKGFQGVVKRHGFAGVGGATHGQHNRQRAPGSIGACSFPARVFKGMRMGGRMGNQRVKIQNLRVLKVMPEQNLLVVTGAVPGHKGATVFIEK